MIGWVTIVVLVVFALMQAHLVVMGVLSFRDLRRHQARTEFGRVDDMLVSAFTPPVSIIVPAYNEEAGIVESIRSMAMLRYPRFEIVVVNDGSTDHTLQWLIEEFDLVEANTPIRSAMSTAPIRRVFQSNLPLDIVVVDKVNGGKTDALNAGTLVARHPYVLFTDADVVFDGDCLLNAMRHVVEDRRRVVAVGGNIRPINGCTVNRGRVTKTALPRRTIELMQVLEYIRSFVGARPGWSLLNGLVIISGAFGIYSREVLEEVGGFREGHLGEDLDLTMRIHRHMRETGREYRMVHAPDAVGWTEVPSTWRVLRRQRFRWHRGLRMVMSDDRDVLLNARYGALGLVTWPSFLLFEYLSPFIEVAGWVLLPVAWATGALAPGVAIPLLAFGILLGAVNSLLALFLDERFGYFNHPRDNLRLLWIVAIENLGWRQVTVLWRLAASFGSVEQSWGEMSRRGVGNLSRAA